MMHGQTKIKLHLVGYENTHLAMHGYMNVKFQAFVYFGYRHQDVRTTI